MKPLPAEDLEHILRHTQALWTPLRGRRIFITGGTGFFGSWLLESLAFCNRRLGLEVSATVLSRNPDAFLRERPHLAGEESIRFVRGDVRDFAIPEGPFDAIVHAATASSGVEAEEPELAANMVAGMERVLAFARSAGARRLLFTSSGAVYGRQPAHATHLPESYEGNPETAYGEAKLACERMCAEFARAADVQVSIARCFAFVGPHLPLDRHFAIGNFIGDALAGRTIRIGGDGTPMRSYLYAADLAVWLWTLLLSPMGGNEGVRTYNVGSGEAISIHDLAREVAAELNPSLQIEIAQAAVPGTPRAQYVPDVSKAEAELGLRQRVGLREAIRRTADWHRL